MATLRNVFHDIAESIRAKGVSGTMKPIEMASKIGEIQTGGGSEDYAPIKFTSLYNNNILRIHYGVYSPSVYLEYSYDGVNWQEYPQPESWGEYGGYYPDIQINQGQSIFFRSQQVGNPQWGGYQSIESGCNFDFKFNNNSKFEISGDWRSLIGKPSYYPYERSGLGIFRDIKYAITFPDKIDISGMNRIDYVAYKMFSGCISLTTTPELPATTLANYCYSNMFNGCTSLVKAPTVLPATTLANYCYQGMFQNCTSLIQAPELPATTLHRGCYSEMFKGCTSLTTAPELPATTLANYCYSNMFNGCTSLKRIKMNASSGSWGNSMFNGCTSLELVDMTGSTGVPQLENVNNFDNTNDTYKIVVPDSLYDTWIAATNWASIASHIMKQSDWNAAHPDDQL